MAYEHKDGAGTIFIVPKEERKANSPFASGQFKTPTGQSLDIALWYATDKDSGNVRRDSKGNVMFSVKVTTPYQKAQKDDVPDSDLPF